MRSIKGQHRVVATSWRSASAQGHCTSRRAHAQPLMIPSDARHYLAELQMMQTCRMCSCLVAIAVGISSAGHLFSWCSRHAAV